MSDVPSYITVRGVAVPFNVARFDGSRVEAFDPGAFDDMLARNVTVPLFWDSHDDGPGTMRLANEARLFASADGLMFSATVDTRQAAGGSFRWALLAAMTRRREPVDECSIGDLTITSERRETIDGNRCSLVTKASIGHVAVCRRGTTVYGTSTGAWPCHLPLNTAPLRIRELSAKWEAGKAAVVLEAKRSNLLADVDRLIRISDRADRDLNDAEFASINAKLAAVRAIDSDLAVIRSGQ
ncbi:MAG: hypothetical protein KF723_22725 [Rhizobiaceae bacterium]|nr:hypothetical protein [Rhizobiaceae bacterium]